jgi:hypothetical protein
MNGKPQMKGKFQANVKVDTFYFYYPSGVLMTKGAYKDNIRFGIWTNYYENGRIRDRVVFFQDFIRAIEYYDENGSPRMINGTGEWQTEYYNDFVNEIINVTGEYKDSLRHGTWKFYRRSLTPGMNHDKKIECVEEYDNGKFVRGKYYWGGGGIQDIGVPTMNILPEARKFEKLEKWTASKYASREVYPYLKFLAKTDSTVFPVDKLAAFPGGLDSLTKIFQREMRFPKSYVASQKLRSSGVQIMISEEGKLKVTADYNKRLAQVNPDNQLFYERMMKTIKKLPAWTPAERNNKRVQNYFYFTVNMDNGQISIQLLSLNEKTKV